MVRMPSSVNPVASQGITHIVCVRQENEKSFIKPNFPDEFIYQGRSILMFIDQCSSMVAHLVESRVRIPSSFQTVHKAQNLGLRTEPFDPQEQIFDLNIKTITIDMTCLNS